jgi:hypothetical protein
MELRLAVLIKHYELAVDRAVGKLPKVRGYLGEKRYKVVAATSEEVELLAVLDQQRPVTVVL